MSHIRTVVQVLVLLGLVVYVGVLTWDVRATHHDLSALQGEVHALRQEVTAQAQHRRESRHRSTVVHAPTARVQVGVSSFDYVFRPAQLRVKAGVRITWINATASTHSVTSDRAGVFNRTVPAHGQATLVFPRAGSYAYHCSFHPYQRGVIVVTG